MGMTVNCYAILSPGEDSTVIDDELGGLTPRMMLLLPWFTRAKVMIFIILSLQ